MTASPSPNADDAAPVRVEVQGKAVRVAGETACCDALALRAALERHRGGATTVEIELAQPDGQALDDVLVAATGTALRRVVLLSDGSRYELATAPSKFPTHDLRPGPDGLLHLRALRAGALPAADTAELSWSPQDDADQSALKAKLASICTSQCVFLLSHTTKDATIPLVSMLHSLVGLATNGRPLGELYVNPRHDGGVGEVSGRLPPEVIQRIVREHFELMRDCYLSGLARHPNLTGRVTVRFVISREGLVSLARDEGSDLPDAQVRDCVINAFTKLEFPKPEGGIVTVVYPILLAPD
jgi:hypothetical protein